MRMRRRRVTRSRLAAMVLAVGLLFSAATVAGQDATAGAAASLTLVTALAYVLRRRSILRRRRAIACANAEKPATHKTPAERPTNTIRAAAVYAEEAAGGDQDRGYPGADSPAALLARLQRTASRMEQMVAESQREA